MKMHLFIAGFVMTYVTGCLLIMRKWLKDDVELLSNDSLKKSLEQMHRNELIDLD